ncbi:MAG: divalent cation transporter [Candidatus Thorarchaeota archaeon]|nr:divalent cation transporter [Candidatus Thorarchaeota archaeon]
MKSVVLSITSKVFRETLPVVLGATIGELLAGLVLGGMKESLMLLPGLIVLIPAVLDLRGCISSALGSRLGSALHLGVMGWDKGLNTELTSNIQAALFLSGATSVFVGAVAYMVNMALKIPTIGFIGLVGISFASGIMAAVTQVTITIIVSFTSYRRGLDPDNITIPAMATIGDILGVTYIFLVASLYGGFLV